MLTRKTFATALATALLLTGGAFMAEDSFADPGHGRGHGRGLGRGHEKHGCQPRPPRYAYPEAWAVFGFSVPLLDDDGFDRRARHRDSYYRYDRDRWYDVDDDDGPRRKHRHR